MGIPSYFKYIISNYEVIFKISKSIKHIDNLYIDSNSIIYDCLRNINMDTYNTLMLKGETYSEVLEKFETELMHLVLDKIRFYITTTSPRKRVYVALDGAVPYSKIEQQRQRRYKSAFTKKLEKTYSENFMKASIEAVNILKNTRHKNKLLDILNNIKHHNVNTFQWDQTAITPGTNFMKKLDSFLQYHLVTDASPEINKQQIEIKFSGSNSPGEGEHKLFEFIRNVDHKNDNTSVYGLDADLIMLSLNHLQYTRRIYLIREKPDFNNELDNIYEEGELMFMSINHLASNIINRMTNNKFVSNDVRMNKIQDYIFISFLLGNDFMPHFPALNIRINGIETLFNYYSDTFSVNETIIKNKKIVWKNLRMFLEKIANQERSIIIANTDKHLKEQTYRNKNSTQNDSPPKNVLNNMISLLQNCDDVNNTREVFEKCRKQYVSNELYGFNLLPTRNRIKEEYINPQENGWQQRYYYALFNIDKSYLKRIDDTNKDNYNNIIKHISINYLEGLEWCFEYYNFGCKNTKWTYNFSYPPLLEDLYKYVPLFETTFLEKEKSFIDSMSQLCYVIPKEAFHLLPENVSHSLMSKYKYNYDVSHKFVWAYSKYFWEAHVEFPHVDLDQFSEYVKNYNS
jgi:5'-3' exoribonuclease 1